jgi:hypothetical protein
MPVASWRLGGVMKAHHLLLSGAVGFVMAGVASAQAPRTAGPDIADLIEVEAIAVAP